MRLGETVSPLKEFVEGWREQGCKRTHDWNSQVLSKEAGGGGGGSLEGRLLSLVTLHTRSLIRFLYAKNIFSLSQMEKQGRETGWGNCWCRPKGTHPTPNSWRLFPRGALREAAGRGAGLIHRSCGSQEAPDRPRRWLQLRD